MINDLKYLILSYLEVEEILEFPEADKILKFVDLKKWNWFERNFGWFTDFSDVPINIKFTRFSMLMTSYDMYKEISNETFEEKTCRYIYDNYPIIPIRD